MNEYKLYKKIAFYFCLAGILIYVFFSYLIYKSNYEMISQSSTQVLNQIENNVKKSKSIIENKKITFQNNYLNRVKAIDFILSSKSDFRTIQSLKQIKQLMNIKYIHIIDNDGQIVLSSEDDIVQNIMSMQNIFQQWIQDDQENYILLGNESPCDEDLIAIKSKISQYSFILIGIDQKIYQEMIERYSIQTLISNSSIEKLISEYVIDLSNCQIIATSSKKLLYSYISLENLEKIIDSNNGKIVHLNDYRYVKTKQYDNYLLVATTHFSAILYTFKEKVIFLFFITLLLFALIYILKNYFKKNIVEEISFMKTNVDKLVSGDKDVEFFVQNNEKFAKLNQSLNDLKRSYGYKANRMSKIIEFTGVDFAMFECLYAIDTNLFSKNIPILLGLDQNKWLELKTEPKKFENYILELEKQMNDEHLIELNGRYLSIYSYQWEDEFFGVIMDCTKDIHKNTILQNRLEQIETSSQIDAFATNAKYAKEAMEMMDAILSNDVVSWWELKQSSLEHQDAMLNANAQVSNVVKNFIAKAHEAGNKLYDNTIPKDRKEVIDYKGSASMEAQQYSEWWYTAKPYEASNFAIDNTDKAYMSKDNVEKDSYVQIDLGKEMDVYSIYLLQGRTETDKTVSGKFSYSIDGQNWIELGKEVSDYETILTNLNIKAQYIRFTASKAEDFQWFVRDFKVNKDISNEIASSSIEGYTGEVVREIEESSDGTAPVVLAHYNDEIEVKAGDTFTLSLRDFKYIKDVKADFGVNGVVEFTRNDVDWVMATQDQLASHPIATRVRFRATENGTIKNATLKVTNEERNPGTYTSNYTFRDGYGLDRINNFDIASNAVSVTTEAGQYLQLDLGRVTHVRDLKLIFNESYSGDRPTDVTLSYSVDGEEWINLPYNIYSWYNEFTNINVDARYLKYTVNQTRGGTWTRIGEFSVNTSAPETVWEASVNGKQPTNRVTNMNDYDLSTNYSPVSNIKAGDTIVYHFNKDRDLKRLHVLQSSKNITGAKVIARTVDRKEIVLGTLDKGYTILDMPKQVDVESIKIEFTKDFAVDENNPVEIYEVTPEFYTLDEIKEQGKALIKEAKELLKTPTNTKDGKEVLESAISSLEALVNSSTDRHEIAKGINELKAAMEYYKSGNSGEDNGNNNGDNGAIKPDSPDTGESTNTTLFATMLMASAAMLTFLKRKKRED